MIAAAMSTQQMAAMEQRLEQKLKNQRVPGEEVQTGKKRQLQSARSTRRRRLGFAGRIFAKEKHQKGQEDRKE